MRLAPLALVLLAGRPTDGNPRKLIPNAGGWFTDGRIPSLTLP